MGSEHRTVIVSAPANDNTASSTPAAANDNSPVPPEAPTATSVRQSIGSVNQPSKQQRSITRIVGVIPTVAMTFQTATIGPSTNPDLAWSRSASTDKKRWEIGLYQNSVCCTAN
jgi:hypothetical protein